MNRVGKTWCSEIGTLTSPDASNSGASSDLREQISLHQTVLTENNCIYDSLLVVHPERSCRDPKQAVPLLRFFLNTIAGAQKLSASANRVAKFHVHLEEILGVQLTTTRELARLVGHILSMSIALGPAARLLTRAMYLAIDNQCSWETHIRVGGEIQRELQFWVCSFDSLHGQQASRSPAIEGPNHCTARDKSDTSRPDWGYHEYQIQEGVEEKRQHYKRQALASAIADLLAAR